MMYLVVRRKGIHNECEDGIEKPILHDRLFPVMPLGDPRDGFFYATLSLMIDSHYLASIIVYLLAKILTVSILLFKIY